MQRAVPVTRRVAKSEACRRALLLELDGPGLENIAHQAVADALMAISERLDRFRGEARFTTWASKFVISNVATKDEPSLLASPRNPLRTRRLVQDRLEDRLGPRRRSGSPGGRGAVSSAVEQNLSERQCLLFVALAEHFSPEEILEIIGIVINMNVWTRLKMAEGAVPRIAEQAMS